MRKTSGLEGDASVAREVAASGESGSDSAVVPDGAKCLVWGAAMQEGLRKRSLYRRKSSDRGGGRTSDVAMAVVATGVVRFVMQG